MTQQTQYGNGDATYQAAGGQTGIRIPEAHKHLDITMVERDLWLECMARALSEQDYPSALVEYLQHQLFIPAERVRQVCMGE